MLSVACVKALAHQAYITDVKYIDGELSFKLWQDAPLKVDSLDTFMKSFNGDLRFVGGPQGGFRLKAKTKEQDELLEIASDALERMLVIFDNTDEDDFQATDKADNKEEDYES